jgi:hypothetical protein
MLSEINDEEAQISYLEEMLAPKAKDTGKLSPPDSMLSEIFDEEDQISYLEELMAPKAKDTGKLSPPDSMLSEIFDEEDQISYLEEMLAEAKSTGNIITFDTSSQAANALKQETMSGMFNQIMNEEVQIA